MMMVELTTAASAVLPVNELADHLRLARGFTDDGSQDAQLEGCLRSAASAIEARIGKALFERRFALSLTHWAAAERHTLPVAPVKSIESVKLISRAGVEMIVEPERYVLIRSTHGPAIEAAAGHLPTPSRGGTIELEFTAGFSADWTGIPADLKQAVIILASEFWGQDFNTEQGMPVAVAVLLEPHRQLRLRGATA